VFPNFFLCGDVGVIRVCVVGANGCTYVILSGNGTFLIFDPRWPRAVLFSLVVCSVLLSLVDSLFMSFICCSIQVCFCLLDFCPFEATQGVQHIRGRNKTAPNKLYSEALCSKPESHLIFHLT
jgi:hypothetical protein